MIPKKPKLEYGDFTTYGDTNIARAIVYFTDVFSDYLQAKEEASKGEYITGTYSGKNLEKFNPDPPEHEDDWTIKLHMLSYQIKAGEKKWVDVENYIRDNFVSKEKIKRELEEVMVELCDYRVNTAIGKINKSLGLEL